MVRKTVIGTVGFLSLLSVLWYLGYFGVHSEAQEQPATEEVISAAHPSAVSWALFDIESGEIISGKQSDAVLPMASITKLFTAYAADAGEQLDTETVINWNDLYTEGRSGRLQHGERLSVRELLFPLLLESSNDAGAALGRVLGDEYLQEVDALRTALGLTETTVVDPTGLDPRNVSNAKELAVFFAYVKKHHPFITDITQLRRYTDGRRGLVNNVPAREMQIFRGGKHGYLPEAGRTFVGAFELSNGQEVGIVLLGSEDIVQDVRMLLEYAQKLAPRSSLL